MRDDAFHRWFEALERRHLANLTFSEVRRALQALSSLYIERRDRLDSSSAFSGAGKRAAFALYYGPLHFLIVREILAALHANMPGKIAAIIDIGCGTGVAGAAWVLETDNRPQVIGVDRNPWALQECKWTYQQFGVHGVAKSADVSRLRVPAHTAVIAAFTMNEIDPASRTRFRDDFVTVAKTGAPVLIVEPIARRLVSWWSDWAEKWKSIGGREDEWRFQVKLPERLALMDRAAGLDHRELTGRSLWLPPLS